MKRKIELVAFDLDGTLVDSKADIAFSMNRAMREHGLPERSIKDYKTIVGGGAWEAVMRACPAGTPEDIMESVFTLYKKIYPENCCKMTKVYNGIHELLARLQRERIVLAVLTNKTHIITEIMLEHYFPQRPFSAVLGNREDIPLKPQLIWENGSVMSWAYLWRRPCISETVVLIFTLPGFRDLCPWARHGAFAAETNCPALGPK